MTAMTVAAARAAHLVVDHEPLIFADSLAATLLGDQAGPLLAYHRGNPAHDVLAVARATVTTRSRFTEERLAEAARRGVSQYLILGAGLDSFAWRSPLAARVRVIEADHPGAQRWKRARLAEAGMTARGDVRYAGIDLEAGTLDAALTTAGFDFGQPALISWLGVIMYLSKDAITSTLATLSRCAPRTASRWPPACRSARRSPIRCGTGPTRSGPPAWAGWRTRGAPVQAAINAPATGGGTLGATHPDRDAQGDTDDDDGERRHLD